MECLSPGRNLGIFDECGKALPLDTSQLDSTRHDTTLPSFAVNFVLERCALSLQSLLQKSLPTVTSKRQWCVAIEVQPPLAKVVWLSAAFAHAVLVAVPVWRLAFIRLISAAAPASRR